MPLEIRLIDDSEYRAVIDFHNNTRNLNGHAKKVMRGTREFCWEFLDGPDRKAVYACAWEVEDGKEPVLIGTQCMIIHRMISTVGEMILAAKGEDTLLEINALLKYKHRDILKELNALLTDTCRNLGVEFLWGFNSLPATFRRLGYKTPFKSVNTVLVLNPAKSCQYLLRLRAEGTVWGKLKIAALTGLSYVCSLKRNFVPASKNGCRISSGIDENTSLFQHAAYPDRLFFLIQDQEYLRWRTRDNPYPVKYKFFQLLDHGNRVKARIICSLNGNTAYIEQALFAKDLKKKSVNYFIKSMVKSLENEPVFLVRYTGLSNNALSIREMDLFRNMGFVSTGTGEWFTFKPLSDNPLITPGNIYLSHLYKQGRS
ncbi:MAG: hypothetical protein WCK34_01970 [Bacteroidota bacterium]